MMTTIAHISLLAAALLDLCAMMRHESASLRHNNFSNKRFYAWIRESGDLTAPKRLLVLAVLIACCTTMARTSWMVIILLAAALAVQGIMLAFKRGEDEGGKTARRSWIIGCVALVISLLVTCLAAYLGSLSNEADALQAGSITAVIMLAISPLLAMLANSLMGRYRGGSPTPENPENGNP